MPNTLGNRVKMSVSGTPGTGTITLGSAVSGFQTFAAAGIPNAATVPYVIEDGSNWEVGVGTYTSSGTTLARTSITASSNSGSAISATSSAIVMISPLAADLQAGTAAGNLVQIDSNSGITIPGTLVMGGSFLRNRIINGGFAIDQRNAAASQTITAGAALAYTVDCWYAYCTGANVTGQQVAGTAPAKNAYKFTGATSNTLVGFGQRIEQLNAYDLASSAVTFSAYMTASTNTTITWYLYGPSSTADTFGSIASPSVTQIATGTFSVTSTRTQFSATISSATMSGYNKGLELRFVAASGLGNAVTWTIEDIQLEAGPVVTPFERRPYGIETLLSQRYYISAPANVVIFPSSGAYNSAQFPVVMRTTPTVVITPNSPTTISGQAVSTYGFYAASSAAPMGAAYTSSAVL